MDSSVSYIDDEKIESHVTKSQVLEMAYQDALRNTDLILKDEGARRLRLRILLLENENDELHEQLALADDRIDVLEQGGDEVRAQLELAQEDYRQQESDLRLQTRELKNLQAELDSMNGVTMDSTKVLTEKLALVRELATIKPELEHLRSQATYQQTVLSEKLVLQRQVSSLEVELETEKRASKRATEKSRNKDREAEMQQQIDDLQKDLTREKRERERDLKEAEKDFEAERVALKRFTTKGNNKERVIDLEQRLEEMQEELMRERRETEKLRKGFEKDLEANKSTETSKGNKKKNIELERELAALQEELDSLKKAHAQEIREKDKARKEAEQELHAAETQKTVLESKLDQLRTKIKGVKEELKECQAELSQVRAAAVKGTSATTKAASTAKNPRKRTAVEISTDGNIGTPDGVAVRGKRPPVKRGRIDSTLVGEKSMFSITPFLNRTVNMTLDTPVQDEDDEVGTGPVQVAKDMKTVGESEVAILNSDASPSTQLKPKSKKQPAAEKTLGESTASNANKKATAKTSRPASTLESVVEEEGDENEDPDSAPTGPKLSTVKQQATKPSKKQLPIIDEVEPKKKKRKLLNGGGGKTLFDEDDGEAVKRPAKVTLGPARLLVKGGLAGPKGGLKGGVGAASGFCVFSPLKKDRRGVGASFLG